MTRLHCPKCDDDYLITGEFEILSGETTVVCPGCHTTWHMEIEMFEVDDELEEQEAKA